MNKRRISIAILALMIIMLSTTVLASSIDFPSAVFQNQNFKLAHDSGAVDCDMPATGGNRCRVAWVSPSGADDGFFAEKPVNPDPANGDSWQKFTELGDYTVTIEECYGGISNCTGVPVDTNTVTVLDPVVIGQVDVSWTYNGANDNLFIQGYAPTGAVSASMIWKDSTGANLEWPPRCINAIDQTANPEFGPFIKYQPQTDGWADDTWNLLVRFYNTTGCTGTEVWPRGYGNEFDYLAIQILFADVADLQTDLDSVNASLQVQIALLHNMSGNISALEGTVIDLQNQIDNITADIATINAQLVNITGDVAALQTDVLTLQTAVGTLQTQVVALQAQIDAMNHGDLDLVWNEGAMNLRAKIKFPLGATHAKLMAYDQDDSLAYTYPSSIIPDSDNYKNVDWDVSAWDMQAYTIKVQFFNDTDDQVDRWVTALFDDLWIMWLEERIDMVEDDLYGYPVLDGIVWDVVNDTCASEGYSADNCTIETFCQISVDNGPMAAFFTDMTLTEASWFSAFLGIDDMTTLNYVWDACKQVQIWEIGSTVYGDGEEDFAEAARYGFCSWREELNETEGVYPDLCDSPNETQNWLDTLTELGLDDRINILAWEFYSDSVDQWQNITGLWDQVWLLWDEVHSLWAAIEDLENMSLITFDYLSPRYGGPSLDLSGYAPGDAQSVQVWFSGLHSGAFYSQCIPTVDQAASPEFSLEDIDLSSWEVDSYIIQGVFLNESGCNGYVVNPEARIIFDSLLDDWLHENELGFDLMDTQYFEVWNPQESFTRKMSWAFTAPKDGWYWFELVNPTSDNGEDISKEFAGGTSYWINSHETKYFKNRNVRFPPEEGSYKVKLKAHNAFTSETIKSNAFRLIIDDLTQPWDVFNATAVVNVPTDGASPRGIYWSASPMVEMTGMLNSETEWSNTFRCLIWNYKESDQSSLYERWDYLLFLYLLPPGMPQPPIYCSGDINLSELDPMVEEEGKAPLFKIEICGDPESGNSKCDSKMFGYDFSAPVINEESLNPGTLDAVHGVWNFSADVTDDGEIARVWFTLTNKSNASQNCSLGDANNTEGDTWLVQYDTTGNCTPDGYYNFTVYAIDYAGNEAELTIDPLVDNTPPVIDWVNMEGYFGENGGFMIEAFLTDLPNQPNPLTGEYPTGVVEAKAEVTGYTCDDEGSFSEEDCTLSWCEYYDEYSHWDCDEFDYYDSDCLLSYGEECTAQWNNASYWMELYYLNASEANFSNETACFEYFMDDCYDRDYSDCYDFCDIQGYQFDSFEECFADCSEEHCTWMETFYWDDCNNESGYDPGCAESVATTCEAWEEITAANYTSYQDCYDDMIVGCPMVLGLDECLAEFDAYCLANWSNEGDSYEECLGHLCYEDRCEEHWLEDCDESYSYDCTYDEGYYDNCTAWDYAAPGCVARYQGECADFWNDSGYWMGGYSLNASEANFSSPEACFDYWNETNCTTSYSDCDTWCGFAIADGYYVWEDEGYESYDACVADCEETNCEWQAYYTVEDCVADVEADCEYYDTEYDYASYEDCVDDLTLDCYRDYCGYNDEGVNEQVSCSANCFADFNCSEESRIYDEPVLVDLALVEGEDSLAGLWEGTLDGTALEADKHYEVRVYAMDNATNNNTGNNTNETMYDFFSDLGWTVTVGTPEETYFSGQSFTASGKVVPTDGASYPSEDETVTLTPGSKLANFGFGSGSFARNMVLSGTGERTITATYWPDEACTDRSYTGTTSITLLAPPKNGGGGGGGSFSSGQHDCDDGYSWDGDRCVKNEEEPKETGGSQSDDVSGGSDTQDDGSQREEEGSGSAADEPNETPASDLITGAVTGGGLGVLSWLGIALGILVVLFGLYWIVRRK